MTHPDDFKHLDKLNNKSGKPKIDKTAKIYERNWSTGEIRWRYCGESIDNFTWPNYGRKFKKSEY
jgi:hypothetical protein